MGKSIKRYMVTRIEEIIHFHEVDATSKREAIAILNDNTRSCVDTCTGQTYATDTFKAVIIDDSIGD